MTGTNTRDVTYAPPVRVYQASSASMVEVADDSADLVLTSPPYFPASAEPVLVGDKNLSAAEIDVAVADTIGFAWSLRPVFAECARVLAPGGFAILQTRDVRFGPRLVPVEGVHRSLMEGAGLSLYARHFWRPQHLTIARRRVMASLTRRFAPLPFDPEVFLVFRKDGPERPADHVRSCDPLLTQDIMRTPVGRQPVHHRHHSPIPVVEAFVSTYCPPGGVVVDPFAGAGTVLRVAKALGRGAVGYDVDRTAFAAMQQNVGLESAP